MFEKTYLADESHGLSITTYSSTEYLPNGYAGKGVFKVLDEYREKTNKDRFYFIICKSKPSSLFKEFTLYQYAYKVNRENPEQGKLPHLYAISKVENIHSAVDFFIVNNIELIIANTSAYNRSKKSFEGKRSSL